MERPARATVKGQRDTLGGEGGGRQRAAPRRQHASCLGCCEFGRYRAGRCVSHRSPASALASLTGGVRDGCNREAAALAALQLSQQKGSRIKGTNYILPQTFGLMSKWAGVVISALSRRRRAFLCQGRRAARPRLMRPCCTGSSGGTANPFICCCSSYLPHAEPAPLRPARTPPPGGGEARISPPKPSPLHKQPNRREGSPGPTGGGNPDRSEHRPNLTGSGEPGSAKL